MSKVNVITKLCADAREVLSKANKDKAKKLTTKDRKKLKKGKLGK